ncbi:hypothetical protein HNY73_002479 [Argiope bruennichi]|uniref:Uncharacterized protein n=1 Tax=Argiope bruennichi TaxID=94029 RepID=A0A8T0FTN3_ARGBR|nr:hypothetical protein HNY73_002479 [Argiope bruennichi]
MIDNSHAFMSLKPDDMFECFRTLMCPLNRTEDFYKLDEEFAPELKEKTWELIKNVFGVEGPDNTLENWVKYRAVTCDFPEDKFKKLFNEYFQLAGEHWLEACIDNFSEKCKHSEEAAIKYQTVIISIGRSIFFHQWSHKQHNITFIWCTLALDVDGGAFPL